MSKSLIGMVVVVVLVLLGITALSRMDTTKPLKHVEKPVPDNALAQ